MSGAAAKSGPTVPSLELVHLLTAEFLSPAEVAGLLNVSRKALADMRLKRQGPTFILQRGGVVVYPVESIKQCLRARKENQPRHGVREMRWSRTVCSGMRKSG